jgi:hypothetical protein
MAELAPLAIFIFNRPEHLRQTLASLSQCEGFDETPLIVFGDGPKRDDQVPKVKAARAVAREMLGDRADYRFSGLNKGLARSLIDGVSALVTEHGRAIVIEDDLVLAPGFLTFMNAALDRYADEETVYQVSGHNFDVPALAQSKRAVLLPLTTTWGWATWRRAWRQLDEAATGWEELARNRALRRRFNLDGAYDYAAMLKRQKQGKGHSWGILWYWSVYRRNGLALFPPRTLVYNIGMDSAGTNGRGIFRRFKASNDPSRRTFPAAGFDLPAPVLDYQAFSAVRRTIWYLNGGRLGQIVNAVKRLALALPGR